MRVERIVAGRSAPEDLVGSVLTTDVIVGGRRWSKGRRLSADDLGAYAEEMTAGTATVIVLGRDDLHEDEAAIRLATAVAGPGLAIGQPIQSRVDLRATHPGILHVRVAALARLNAVDPLEVFTAFDGTAVEAGDLVASAKIAPHVVAATVVDDALRDSGAASRPLVRVAQYRPMRVAAVVKESVRARDRERFEASVRDKIETLGSTVLSVDYVADDAEPVATALSRATDAGADILLTAGGRSTDPLDPFFSAIEQLGGAVVRHGVPAHPGSMLWLARIGRVAVLGLPTCGAYSKATAADLVLPRLLTGERATRRLVARLGHGGLLTRDQRFRFPAYARTLDAPDG